MIEVITPPEILYTPGSKVETFINRILAHLKIEAGEENVAYQGSVQGYFEAALSRVEAMSGRLILKRTLKFTTDGFSDAITLPASPVASVSTVTYWDGLNVQRTLSGAAYSLLDKNESPRLVPAYGGIWPDTRVFPESVSVTFIAGYGERYEEIPAPLRMAVIQTAADWMRFAGNVATTSIMELPEDAYRACQSFRREWA